MKGVKTMSVANASATRFQSDVIHTIRIMTPNGELVGTVAELRKQNEELLKTLSEITLKLKELEDKVNSFETEE